MAMAPTLTRLRSTSTTVRLSESVWGGGGKEREKRTGQGAGHGAEARPPTGTKEKDISAPDPEDIWNGEDTLVQYVPRSAQKSRVLAINQVVVCVSACLHGE